MSLPLSILDLARINDGASISDAFSDCVRTAKTAESLGYARVWYAEHHNMASVASSATSVLIAHIAAQTRMIRLGAGGVMLPNHSPLAIAEQFGTLAALHPDRIDLGLGRAPGGDRDVIRALRKDGPAAAQRFPQDVVELLALLDAPNPDAPLAVRAIPGEGSQVPVWILGSSLFGAQLAAHLGLPYAFASHFAPQALAQAAQTYRTQFRPSASLDAPHFMMAANVIAADTEDDAQFHATTLQQAFLQIVTGQRAPIPAPMRGFDVPAAFRPHLDAMLRCTAVGTGEQVAAQMANWADTYAPDEFILSMPFFQQDARERSLALTMKHWGEHTGALSSAPALQAAE